MYNHEQNGAQKVMQNDVPNGGKGGREGQGRRSTSQILGGPNTLRHMIRDATRRQATRRQSRRNVMASRIKAKEKTTTLVTPRREPPENVVCCEDHEHLLCE